MKFDTATINGDDGTKAGFDLNLTILERDDGKFFIAAPDHNLEPVFDSHEACEEYILTSYSAPIWDLRLQLRGVQL